MKKVLVILVAVALVVLPMAVSAAPPVKLDKDGNEVEWKWTGCTRIQDGTLLTSTGDPILTGFDA